MRIQTVQGDITVQKDVEAIVNAANTSLLGGGSTKKSRFLKNVVSSKVYVVLSNVGEIMHTFDEKTFAI